MSINSDLYNLQRRYYQESVVATKGEELTVHEIKYVDDVVVKEDLVNSPRHYTRGSIEVIDAIVDWKMDYRRGNIIKYVARAAYKGNELQDLKKAQWYLNHIIAEMEKK